jgi:hypothetical protein
MIIFSENNKPGSVEEQGKKEYEAKYGKVIQDKVSYFEALKPAIKPQLVFNMLSRQR